jgi:NNP family nitrate/nitrite transporter-like MFS transporter
VAIQNITTPFWVFIIAPVRFCRSEFCFQHGKYQFLFPKAKQGSALGVNGGLAISASA